MRTRAPYHLPEDKQKQLRKAQWLEWTTIGFMISIIVVIYLAMGSSQAMKAAWIEDILSLVPPIAFLIAIQFRRKEPTERFPYGYRRAIAIAFLCAALALTIFGLYILYDSTMALVKAEHPTIGMTEIFGLEFWAGWLMIAALAYSAIPPVVLGRMKSSLAEELHQKTLYADADMNKADWMTAVAGIVGVVGIGVGFWWADSAMAVLISLDIVRDGIKNLRDSVTDLMDQRPTTIDRQKKEPLSDQLRNELLQLEWVKDAQIRLREEGDVFTGEAYIIPNDECNLLDKVQKTDDIADSYDWRLYDIVVMPVHSFDQLERTDAKQR